MSYDGSEEDEWEVVDIVHTTTTSASTPKKDKAAKKEDVDELAKKIQAQLSLKNAHDTQQLILMEQKMKQQQKMSQNKLASIQAQLEQITNLQIQQQTQQTQLEKERLKLTHEQQQRLLEQNVQIQSLADHQIATQKQLKLTTQQINKANINNKNINNNIKILSQQQLQQIQQIQQQQNHNNIQQQNQNNMVALQQLLKQQQHQQQQHIHPHQNPNILLPTLPTLNPMNPINPINPSNTVNNNINNTNPPHTVPQNNNSNNNGWLPSFFPFNINGNNNNTANNTKNKNKHKNKNKNKNKSKSKSKNNKNKHKHKPNTLEQDMDITSSPLLQPQQPQQPMINEEKSNILIDVDDDDNDVLDWTNDYGPNKNKSNPIYNNPSLLKLKGSIGDGKYDPQEKRQCGWVLQNKSNALVKLSTTLAQLGDTDPYGMKVTAEKIYEFTLKPNEEVYILIEVEAPSIPGKYCGFFQLFTINDNIKIGDTLEIMCDVKSQFNKNKETKIEQIIKMGFPERKKVVSTLKKHKWNIQQSVDELIGLN